QGEGSMRRLVVARIAVIGCALLAGCASHHHALSCAKPAKVIGTNSLNSQGGWIVVRDDRPVDETANRIAKTYHVRTQPRTYLNGFSVYPVPDDPKFLCDKAVAEVHYAAPQATSRR